MKTKTCTDCGTQKPVAQFYRNRRMADGRLNQCRDCHNEKKKRIRSRNLNDPEWVAAERERANEKEKRHRARHRWKNRARDAVRRALDRGEIERPEECSRCGDGCKPEAHHADYDRPLDVEWLCVSCHAEEHAQEAMV